MVRRLSPRMPEPICARRSSARARSLVVARCSRSRARRIAIALSRFACCDRSASHRTTSPLSWCLILQAESVTLRCCPPAPDPRMNVTSTSSSRMTTSCSRGSGSTATVIVLVCTRPRFSVGGTRCHLCPPGSFSNVAIAPRPTTRRTTKPERSSAIVTLKTPLRAELQVDLELLQNKVLGVRATLGSTNLDDD